MWSVSEARMFRRCPRQWYYKNIVASSVAKDPYRRKAYLLSKLQSVPAWRGQIVDDVISSAIIPCLRRGEKITLEKAKKRAHQQFNEELELARSNARLSAPKKSSSSKLIALHSLYYEGVLDQHQLDLALSEVDQALTNLFTMDEVKDAIKSSSLLIPQRSLVFQYGETSIRAVPDLLVFYNDRAPMVVDWKVHTFGIQEAWLQLGVYALALTNCRPHKDFPATLSCLKPTDLELLEVQLLTKTCRRSRLDEDELERVEAYIADSLAEIEAAVDDKEPRQLTPEDFAVSAFPNVCNSCAFRELCWSGNELN